MLITQLVIDKQLGIKLVTFPSKLAVNVTLRVTYSAIQHYLVGCVYKVYHCSPEFCHALEELFAAKLALGCSSELPRDDQNADAGRIQHQVVTELLDPVHADLALILRVCNTQQ